jgi:hypothetical protein
MIVRIFSEGQYRLEDSERAPIEKLDEQLHAAAGGGEETKFNAALAALLEYVRSHGTKLAADELEGSDLMLPPPDTTLAEASVEFTGEGLIPD